MADQNKPSIADKILKRKKDPAFMKQLDSEQIDYDADDTAKESQKAKDDEIANIVGKSGLQKNIAAMKKRRKKFIIAAPIVLVIGYFIHWFNTPYYAGLDYGFCKIFLELNVQYPDHLVLSEIEHRNDFIRIWYMHTDSFGQERLENIECYHGEHPEWGYYISKIRIDRREVDPAKVERFNTSLTTIAAYPPDLSYPIPLRDALGKIDFQTYLFRKPLF